MAAMGPTDANTACPRCGVRFRCGAGDPAPCPCTAQKLAPALLAELRLRYTGCLCGDCLAALAAAQPAAPAEAAGVYPR